MSEEKLKHHSISDVEFPRQTSTYPGRAKRVKFSNPRRPNIWFFETAELIDHSSVNNISAESNSLFPSSATTSRFY
ncbi:hypothetical protein BGZ46_001836 [Entomortierella lignicola]|nr:hypothetical protein BGZ46_001836 [Entomortierella lignicola]